MRYAIEVVMYYQKIQAFILNNEESSKYFLVNINAELFFDKLLEMSSDNFEKTGQPELTKEQFEQLRGETAPKGDFPYFNAFSLN